jgi:hypothetical protein
VNDWYFDLLTTVCFIHTKGSGERQPVAILDSSSRSYNYEIDPEERIVERIVHAWLGLAVSEQASFLIKSGIFLSICGASLFVALGASYPAVHDTLHNVRHALAVVPCH